MPSITIIWNLTDEELALLEQLVSAFNADAKAAYDARVAVDAAAEPPRDPGPAPVALTREQFVRRIGTKSLRGEIERLQHDYRARNLRVVMAAFDDPGSQKQTALEALGLTMDGLVVKPRGNGSVQK